MLNAFNSVYTALQSFLGRSFWFANFLPVALFTILHVIMALIVIGPISLWGSTVSFTAIDLATAGPGIILAIILVAYLLAPLIPLVGGLLDGSQLPAMVHDYLRGRRLADAYEAKTTINARMDDAGTLRVMDFDAHAANGQLVTAFTAATALGPGAPAASPTALKTARQELERLRGALFAPGLLAGRARAAENAIIAMLAANAPNPGQAPAAALAAETNQACDDFEDLLSKAATEADYRLEITQKRNRVLGALENPMATAIGDARSVTQGYSKETYGVDFDFLWPRLLAAIKAAKKEDPMLDAIDSARSTVDFAIMCLMLSVSLPLWLIMILYLGGPAWAFLATGAAIPFIVAFFYALVFEGQLAFGDVIRTAIDQHRFLVLNMLRQPEPRSRSEERRLWARIRAAEDDARAADLAYAPAKAGGG